MTVTQSECESRRETSQAKREALCLKIESLKREIRIGLVASTTTLSIIIAVINLLGR